MLMKKIIMGLLGVLLVVNCTSSTLLLKAKHRIVTGKATYAETQHHFFTWFGANTVSNQCEEGKVAKVKVSTTPATFFVNLLTLGIYFPKYAGVWCG